MGADGTESRGECDSAEACVPEERYMDSRYVVPCAAGMRQRQAETGAESCILLLSPDRGDAGADLGLRGYLLKVSADLVASESHDIQGILVFV